MKNIGHKGRFKIGVLALIATHFLICCSLAHAQTPAPRLSAGQWQADLAFMAERMARQHPNLYRRVSKADFDAAVKALHEKIPTASENEILVGITRIVAMVKDGHSGMFPAEYFRRGYFPLKFYQYDDGIFIQRASPLYAELAGARVIKVGGLPAVEALRRVGTLVSADNEMGLRDSATFLLSVPELLNGVGIIDDTRSLSLTIEIGSKEKTVEVKPAAAFNEIIRPPVDWADTVLTKPLYLRRPDENFWFEYLKDEKLLYVQQNAVANKPDETVSQFYERVMDFVAANPVDKLVIDLRRNEGGNNGLNRPVVIGLIRSKINERGKLFVITGRRTFSAAQNFVNELEKYTNAIFVGEPTAGRPNHYGDARPITLPNSRLRVDISTLYWQDMDPRDNRQWTAPSIAASLSSVDYRNGADPALRAVLDYRNGSDLLGLIDSAANRNDIGAFVKEYEAARTDPKYRYIETEAPINRLGYDLMRAGKTADAVEVFMLNARVHPKSANVHDSLGDGYQAVGKKDEAIKSYEKALAIDPEYTSAIEALRKLKGQ